MRTRLILACVVATGVAGASCSSSMDLGANDEFPGAGAASGWYSADGHDLQAVTTMREAPYDLAMRNGRLFWTGHPFGIGERTATVRSCLPGDCRASTTTYEVVASPPYPPLGPVVDDDNLFWLRQAMLTCPVSGCAGKPARFEAAGNVPTRAAMDNEYIYFTSEENAGVFKCPKTGCLGAPEPVVLNRPCPFEIEVDDQAVYWHEAASPESTCPSMLPPDDRPTDWFGMTPNGPVMRVAKDGTGLQKIIESQELAGMALDETHVYWSNWYDGGISRCKKTGCTAPEVVANPGPGSLALVVDGASVYWLQEPSGVPENEVLSVMKCPLAGCEAPITLATANSSWRGASPSRATHALAQDSEYLYWPSIIAMESGGGAIWRVRK